MRVYESRQDDLAGRVDLWLTRVRPAQVCAGANRRDLTVLDPHRAVPDDSQPAQFGPALRFPRQREELRSRVYEHGCIITF